MSLKKVGQVKADKGFKIWDLVIYGAIILIVAAVFLAVFLTRDRRPLTGFRVYAADKLVYEYDFAKGETRREEGYAETLSEDGNIISVKITLPAGYNVLEIDKSGSVRVTDADCGKLDCVYTPSLTDGGGIIYCSPHNLKIVPFNYDIDDGNIIA